MLEAIECKSLAKAQGRKGGNENEEDEKMASALRAREGSRVGIDVRRGVAGGVDELDEVAGGGVEAASQVLFLARPSGGGVLLLRARRGAPIKVPQKSFLSPPVAARLSLCFSRFSDETGSKNGSDFCISGLVRPDAIVAKVAELERRALAAQHEGLPP